MKDMFHKEHGVYNRRSCGKKVIGNEAREGDPYFGKAATGEILIR